MNGRGTVEAGQAAGYNSLFKRHGGFDGPIEVFVNSSPSTRDAPAHPEVRTSEPADENRGGVPDGRSGPEESGLLQARWLSRVLETGPQPFAVVDIEQRIIGANRAFGKLVGYTVEELLGTSALDLTAPQSKDLTRRYHADVLATGKNERLIKNYRHKNGSLVPVELMVDVFRDDAGKPVGLYAFVTDISKRQETEAALVESERRTRALFDGIHDAVFVHDQEGKILDANPAACRQLGYSRDEILGLSTSQIDAPEFAVGFQERLRRQLQEGQLTCEGLHRTKSGKLIPVEVTTSTIHVDNQLAVLAIFRDITERKALERTRREFASAQMRNAQEMELKNRALSQSESRYRRLAEGTLDAIVVADGEGRITLFNPAAEKIFGYNPRRSSAGLWSS